MKKLVFLFFSLFSIVAQAQQPSPIPRSIANITQLGRIPISTDRIIVYPTGTIRVTNMADIATAAKAVIRDTNAVPATGNAWMRGHFYRLANTKFVYYYDPVSGIRLDINDFPLASVDSTHLKSNSVALNRLSAQVIALLNSGVQTLTVNGNQLSISDGNSVTLPSGGGGGGGPGIDTLRTYAALRSYTGQANLVYLTHPLIEGFFSRITTTANDDSAVTIVSANSVRWRRFIAHGQIFPSWWRETRDTTDAINRAIEFQIANGGEVLLRRRFSPYNISDKFVVQGSERGCIRLASGGVVRCENGVIVRKGNGVQYAGKPVHMVVAANAINTTWIGGDIDGNPTGQTGFTWGADAVNGCGYLVVQPNSMSYGNYTVGANRNNTIRNARIYGHFSSGVWIGAYKAAVVDSCEIMQCGEAVNFLGGENMSITNSNISRSVSAGGDALEITLTDTGVVKNVTIRNWQGGSAFDFGGRGRYIKAQNFLIDSCGSAISLGSNYFSNTQGGVDTLFSHEVFFEDGEIRNIASASSAAHGTTYFRRVNFTRCAGTNITVQASQGGNFVWGSRNYPVTVEDCRFDSSASSAGIFVLSNRTLIARNNTFANLSVGVLVGGVSGRTEQPDPIITGNIFTRCTWAIQSGANGQSNYNPTAIIEGNTLRENTNAGFDGVTTNMRIINNTNDIVPVLAYNSLNSRGLDMIGTTQQGGTFIDNIIGGSKNQVLTVIAGFSSGGAQTWRDASINAGNLKLKTGGYFFMTRGSSITFRFDSISNLWHEITRTRTQNFNVGSGEAVGDLYHAPLTQNRFVAKSATSNQTAQFVFGFGITDSADVFQNRIWGERIFKISRITVRSTEGISNGQISFYMCTNGGTTPVSNTTITLSGGSNRAQLDFPTFTLWQPSYTTTSWNFRYTTNGAFNHPNAQFLVTVEYEY